MSASTHHDDDDAAAYEAYNPSAAHAVEMTAIVESGSNALLAADRLSSSSGDDVHHGDDATMVDHSQRV